MAHPRPTSDMVFSVPFRDATQGEEVTVYILIEHQSTVDRLMGFRLLSYMCQIWNEQLSGLERSGVPRSRWRLRPILPIVYYTGSQRWQLPLSLSAVMDVPDALSRFVPRFDTCFSGQGARSLMLCEDGSSLGLAITGAATRGISADSLFESTLQSALRYRIRYC